jgi:stress-induced morphogen
MRGLRELWAGYSNAKSRNMVSPEEIRRRIEAALPGAAVAVADSTGAGDHFEVRVRATAFAGKTLVEQHQLVYGALGNLMRQIHALSVQTEAS